MRFCYALVVLFIFTLSGLGFQVSAFDRTQPYEVSAEMDHTLAHLDKRPPSMETIIVLLQFLVSVLSHLPGLVTRCTDIATWLKKYVENGAMPRDRTKKKFFFLSFRLRLVQKGPLRLDGLRYNASYTMQCASA